MSPQRPSKSSTSGTSKPLHRSSQRGLIPMDTSLMILFCANENKTKVTKDIAERVVSILEWQRAVREENDPIDAEGKMARMEENIRRVLKRCPQGTSRRDLQRLTHYNRGGIFVWNTAVNNLLKEEIHFDGNRQLYRLKERGF